MRLLGYRTKDKKRLAGNANQPTIVNIDDVYGLMDHRTSEEIDRVDMRIALMQELNRLSSRDLMIFCTYINMPPINNLAEELGVKPNTISKKRKQIANKLRRRLLGDE